ncbi:calcium-binding protein, partial [bacterium]
MAKILINRASEGFALEAINFRDLIGMKIDVASPTELKLYAGGSGFLNITFSGSGFTYDINKQLMGGVINKVEYWDIDLNFEIKDISVPGAGAMSWLLTNSSQTVFATILAGNDIVDAYFGGDDVLRGYGGNDGLYGGAGADSLFGGEGDDTLSGAIDGPPGTESNFLRGEEGNDLLLGGPGFDDLHGNMGNDTVRGAGGADWVVGGKGED